LPGGSQKPMEFERHPLVPGAPGHMEGHNTHGGLTAGAAFAVKEAMQRFNIPGTVSISLGPAEEQLISRPYVVRAGYFKDVDAIIYVHIGDGMATGYGLANYASISADFAFHGKTAHGAVNPWDGKDALDAVELMDMGAASCASSFIRPIGSTASSPMAGSSPTSFPISPPPGGGCATPTCPTPR
jgi:aminobenzoyl-glutamate utilization protein B